MKITPTLSLSLFSLALLSACPSDTKNGASAGTVGSADEGGTGSGEDTGNGTGEETGNDTATDDSATDDTAEGDSTGCAFAMCVDMPGVAPSCDIWAQDCADGEKCTAYAADGGSSWNANKCVPIDPQKDQAGDACQNTGSGIDGLDTCDIGMLCWDVNPDTMEGYCLEYCTGSPMAPMCNQDALCSIANDGVLPICTATCDPLSIDCPNPDNVCVPHPGDEGFVCILNASGDMGTYGVPCMYGNACNQGLFCANAESVPGCAAEGCCSEFCDVNEANTCSGMGMGQECIPWWEVGMAPPGLDHVGGCGIP